MYINATYCCIIKVLHCYNYRNLSYQERNGRFINLSLRYDRHDNHTGRRVLQNFNYSGYLRRYRRENDIPYREMRESLQYITCKI